MTQEALGLEAELERNFVSLLELGQRQPSLGTVFKLASALRIPAHELVRRTEFQIMKKQ